MTDGRRQLLDVLRRTTVAHVARRCNSTPGAVRHWIAGRNTPSRRTKKALAQSYGIPEESWNTYTISTL